MNQNDSLIEVVGDSVANAIENELSCDNERPSSAFVDNAADGSAETVLGHVDGEGLMASQAAEDRYGITPVDQK